MLVSFTPDFVYSSDINSTYLKILLKLAYAKYREVLNNNRPTPKLRGLKQLTGIKIIRKKSWSEVH